MKQTVMRRVFSFVLAWLLVLSAVPLGLTRVEAAAYTGCLSQRDPRWANYYVGGETIAATGCGILYSRSFMKEVSSLSDLKDADFLHFDSDVEKKFSSVVKRLCSEHGFYPTFKSCGQFASALFSMSCGEGVMFFTDWDNAINNSSYRYLPINYRSAVNIIYPTVTSNAKTHIFAEELIKLFAEEAE